MGMCRVLCGKGVALMCHGWRLVFFIRFCSALGPWDLCPVFKEGEVGLDCVLASFWPQLNQAVTWTGDSAHQSVCVCVFSFLTDSQRCFLATGVQNAFCFSRGFVCSSLCVWSVCVYVCVCVCVECSSARTLAV